MSAEDRVEGKDFYDAGSTALVGLLLQVYPEFIEGLHSGFSP